MELVPVEGMPEVRPGDDIVQLIAERAQVRTGDILVVAQKAVSKAEGRLVELSAVTVGSEATRIAAEIDHDRRLVQLILDESVRIVRQERMLIVETKHGFVCANAGIDHSNVPGEDTVCLLPVDPDGSAARIRPALAARLGVTVGVIVADTFGRPWRMGIHNVALGVAGIPSLVDYRGLRDDHGKDLQVTVVAVADELAAAAGLVMGKTARVPVAVIRGYLLEGPSGTGRDLIRPAELDLFR